jgi:hydrogenase nickel incorporation protein HypA/HybF
MHEFSLTQNLLDLALKNADSKRIVRVNLLIGPFSDEREESIQFYWRDLAKGSPGEGAALHFDHAPAEMKCLDCNGTFYLDEEVSMCKFCYSERLQLLSGDEVRLESIEVE